MTPFPHGHATHPDAHMALALAAVQVDAQLPALGGTPTLGWLYLSDRHAASAEAVLADAQRRWPGVAWVGTVGVGVCASGVEYFDEPGLALMLAALPREHFRVFSGARPLQLIVNSSSGPPRMTSPRWRSSSSTCCNCGPRGRSSSRVKGTR